MTDVYLKSFSKEAYRGLEILCMDKDWDGMFGPWVSLEIAAGFLFRFREVEDKGEYFPKGKSATLQALEQLITEAAKKMGEEK